MKPTKKNSPGERIQKKLAALGFGSRREIERLIEAGEIKVNHKVATLGQHLKGNELIQIKGRRIVLTDLKPDHKTRVIAYHKPIGVLCTRKDEQGRPTVFQDLPSIKNSRWVMIGRLDANTSGLLLFTNNGKFANDLMHPRNEVPREYVVRVFGEVNDSVLQQLKSGVMLEDGEAHFTHIMPINTDDESKNHFFKVGLNEGRNREVRRLWEAVNCQVSRLKRVRYGSFDIPKTLAPGKTIELTPAQVKKLQQCLKPTQSRADSQSQSPQLSQSGQSQSRQSKKPAKPQRRR